MFKIKTFNTIADIGLKQFPNELYQISTDGENPDAIILRSQNLHDIVIPDSVKAIGRAGAGTNNIPVASLTKRGIPVFNTPGANANAVSELVIAGMLLASRHICEAWNYINQLPHQVDDLNQEIEKSKKQFVGFEVSGKTLGIVGLGSVGVKAANAALSLGMKVLGYDPSITVNRAWELSSQVRQMRNLDELLMEADFISLHVPLNEATKNMINHARFQRMKKGAILLNFARNQIIDQSALVDALTENKLSCYVTDFPCQELKNHPRVVNLPHLGASTKEAEENCAIMIVKQIRHFLENGSISNAVNFPQVEVAPLQNQGVRLAIVNENIPNMVAQISSKLADADLNIVSLSNQSLGEIAYTLIETNHDVNPAILKQIADIHGVLQLRVIESSHHH